ncbi:hypothetical protein AVEN_39167-1 [Araneus ventricosus]|uniref:Uncharacterized protein n=1 Tax=Araneus ventricosus TaxID=182803 RepID=A0A4Y2QSV7_ARAVE|nr:hypothetical protein AVEN_39167-1 [Araneus ventricosus]
MRRLQIHALLTPQYTLEFGARMAPCRLGRESRFPATSVLWLEREFYRGKYEMTDSSPVSTPSLAHEFGDFCDEIGDLKGAGIFSISLLGENIRHECARSFHVMSRPTG